MHDKNRITWKRGSDVVMKPKGIIPPETFRTIKPKPPREYKRPAPTTKASPPQLWRLNVNGLLRLVPLEERNPDNAIKSVDVWELLNEFDWEGKQAA
jgi:hypothetical protein